MFEKKLAQVVVEKYKDEEVLDGILEVLGTAQQLLDPNKIETSNLPFCAGVALQEVAEATRVLRAYRIKKFGDKPLTIL